MAPDGGQCWGGPWGAGSLEGEVTGGRDNGVPGGERRGAWARIPHSSGKGDSGDPESIPARGDPGETRPSHQEVAPATSPGLPRGLEFWGLRLIGGPGAPGRKGSGRGGRRARGPRGRRGLEAGSARPGSFRAGVRGRSHAPGPAGGIGGGRPAGGSPSSRPSASRLTPVSGLLPGPVHHRRSRRRLSPGLPRRLQHAPGHVSSPRSVRRAT